MSIPRWKWKVVRMSWAEISNGRHMRLQAAFEKAFLAAGAPADAVMYSETRGAHAYFFTPKAVEIADDLITQYDGEECEQPDVKGFVLLVANLGSREGN